MSDDDWVDRAQRTATDMLNGVSAEDAVTDDEGHPTNGCYNDDFSEQEHKNAERRYLEDPEYADDCDQAVEAIDEAKNRWRLF